MQEKIEIPEEIKIEISENKVKAMKNGDELEKKFDLGRIKLEKKGKKITIKASEPVKKHERSMTGTIKGEIQNMIKGLQEGHEYKLRIIYKHFPMRVKKEGDQIKIENFSGEQKPRYVDIKGDTEVEIKGEEITVRGKDKQKAGQTAANLEQATWLKNKDPRVFEDGIYIKEKPSK